MSAADIEKLIDLLSDLTDRRFWGKIEIDFQAGRIAVIKKTESIKLDRMPTISGQRRIERA